MTSIYHLSENPNLSVLRARVPEIALYCYEDKTKPRVCFAKTISGCLSALQDISREFYVYVPFDDVSYYVPTSDEVRDGSLTGEVWVLNDVKVKCIGVIKSFDWYKFREFQIIRKDGVHEVTKFYYKWKWVKKY